MLVTNCKSSHCECGMQIEQCHGLLCGMKANCPGINRYFKEQKAKQARILIASTIDGLIPKII